MKKITIVVHGRKTKAGTHPVYLRLYRQGKVTLFPLKKYCLPEQFNKEAGRFRKNFPDYEQENDLLRTIEQRAADSLRSFERDGRRFDMEEFRADVFGNAAQSLTQNAHAYIMGHAEQLMSNGKYHTSRNYRNLSHHLRRFRPTAVLADISHEWLREFAQHLTTHGASVGKVGNLMARLRAICNLAKRLPGVPHTWNPFALYRIRLARQDRAARALTLDEIRILESFAGTFYIDLFLLSFYLRGANLNDIARLTGKNIVGGRIEYRRGKTGQPFSIPITPKIQAILDRYAGGHYLLPVLSEGKNIANQYRRISWVAGQCAKSIQEKAAKAGIDPRRLTFYSARHTYATALKTKGVSVEIISDAMGHKDVKTTAHYLARFDRAVIDAADELLR